MTLPAEHNKQNGWPSTRIFLLEAISDSRQSPSWTEFVDLYMPIVYRFCRRRGLQDADAQEVTQNVFIRIVPAMQGFQYDTSRGRFRSWVCTIASRELARYAKTHRRQLSSAEGDPDLMLASRAQNAQAAWCEAHCAQVYDVAVCRVRPLFDSLTWQAFRLTWEQDVPPAEVARQLLRTPQWVYKAKFRVLQRLKSEIASLSADEPAVHQ
jgi:RNA polymerase sigma-70 factor (ECF subfamily)